MSRISEIEIAGKKYPLNFSIKASKEVSARYGGLENIDQAFAEKSVDDSMEEVIWILSILVEQGVAYKRIVEGEEVNGITADDMEVVLGLSDLPVLQGQIMDAMVGGMSREVEVEEDPKNAEATQSN